MSPPDGASRTVPDGTVNVTTRVAGSQAVIVTVVTRRCATVPPGSAPGVGLAIGGSSRSLSGVPGRVRGDTHLIVVHRAHDVAGLDLVEALDRRRDVERRDGAIFPADGDRAGGGVDGLHRSAKRDLFAIRCGLCARKSRGQNQRQEHPQSRLDVVQHGKTPYRRPLTKARLDGRLRSSRLWKSQNCCGTVYSER